MAEEKTNEIVVRDSVIQKSKGADNPMAVVVTETEAQHAMERLYHGQQQITPQILNDLSILGRFTKEMGALTIVRGASVEMMQRLRKASSLIMQMIADIEKKKKLSKENRRFLVELFKCKAEMAKQMAAVSKSLTDAEGTIIQIPHSEDTPITPSFGAGQKVGPGIVMQAKEVHIHENKPGDKPAA